LANKITVVKECDATEVKLLTFRLVNKKLTQFLNKKVQAKYTVEAIGQHVLYLSGKRVR